MVRIKKQLPKKLGDKLSNKFDMGGEIPIENNTSKSNGAEIASAVAGVGSSILGGLAADPSIESTLKAEKTKVNSAYSKSSLSGMLSDWAPQQNESVAMAGASGALSGAAAGMAAGPWGALAGAVGGLASGLFGSTSRNKEREAANKKVTDAFMTQNTMLSQKGTLDLLSNIEAFGGWVPGHGGDYSTGLTTFNTGGSHEENPNEGIQQGVDENGIPNKVEEGETKWDNYIFSKRLDIPKGFSNQYNLGNIKPKNYAQVSKNLSKESAERPFDPISKRGRDSMLDRLRTAQEDHKLINQADGAINSVFEANELGDVIYAEGGSIHIKPSKVGTFTTAAKTYGKGVQEFATQVLSNKDNYSSEMIKKANFAKNAKGWQHALGGNLYPNGGSIVPQSIQDNPFGGVEGPKLLYRSQLPQSYGSQEVSRSNSSNDMGLYAPALANVGNLMSDLFSKPERVNYGRVDLGDFMKRRELPYEPFDREYAANKMRAQSNATSRQIVDNSAGNSASARAALVAHNYNTLGSIGDLYIKSDELNRTRKNESIAFADSQDKKLAGMSAQQQQYNISIGMREDDMNARNRAARRSGIRDGTNTVAQNIGEASRYSGNKEMLERIYGYDTEGRYSNTHKADGGFLFDPDIKNFLNKVKRGKK